MPATSSAKRPDDGAGRAGQSGGAGVGALFRSVGALHFDRTLLPATSDPQPPWIAAHFDRTRLAATSDPQPPWIAAHLAVLHEASARVGLDVDLDFFAAVRTRHDELVIHLLTGTSLPDECRSAEAKGLNDGKADLKVR